MLNPRETLISIKSTQKLLNISRQTITSNSSPSTPNANVAPPTNAAEQQNVNNQTEDEQTTITSSIQQSSHDEIQINTTESTNIDVESTGYATGVEATPVPSNHEDLQQDKSIKLEVSDLDTRRFSLTEPFCRICYDNEIDTEGKMEKPVFACRCRGTVGLVHLSCLQKWLTISQTARCELCHFQFPTKQILRYGKLRSVQVWFTNIVDRSQLFFDISAWLIMTPIIMITLYMVRLSLKWLHDTIKKMKYTPLAAYATVMGIGTCALLVTIVYVLFTFIIVVYYTWSWYQFYSSDGNRVIVLTAMTEPAPIRIEQ